MRGPAEAPPPPARDESPGGRRPFYWPWLARRAGGKNPAVEGQERISAKVEQARAVERILLRLGWSVAVLGLIGVAVFAVFWAIGDLDPEQAVGLILGTCLATILSGATAYGSGVNIGLGAERLELAARSTSPPEGSAG